MSEKKLFGAILNATAAPAWRFLTRKLIEAEVKDAKASSDEIHNAQNHQEIVEKLKDNSEALRRYLASQTIGH